MTDDHARPIPRRPARRSAGDDDVYVVDTRGRGARAPRRSDARPRSGATGAVPPPADDEYDELGRPVRRVGPPPPGAPTSPRVPRDPRRRRGGGRAWVRLVALLLVAYLAVLVIAPLHAWSSVARVDASPAGTRPAAGDGHTYLLVGSDSREGLTAAQKRALGTGSADGRRTDTIILVHVPSGSGKAALISIPRDSFLPIPGNGKNKVNAAFAIGGPKLLTQTLERASGLRIDGYLEIGFGGFASVVDSLGGVDICVKNDLLDAKAHIDLTKGCQSLDGPTALGYVRARYSDPRGDIGRAERQRQFLGAVVKKAATPGTVLLPWRWWGFTHAAASAVVVGEDTGLVDAYRILSTLRSVSNDGALSLVVPIADANASTSAGSSVLWDEKRAAQLFSMLRDGTPLDAPPPGTDGTPGG